MEPSHNISHSPGRTASNHLGCRVYVGFRQDEDARVEERVIGLRFQCEVGNNVSGFGFRSAVSGSDRIP